MIPLRRHAHSWPLAVALCAWGLASDAASAQAVPADTRCELHVWPAASMTAVRQRASESMYDGDVLTGIIKRTQQAAAAKGDIRAAGVLETPDVQQPLSPSRQASVMKELPLDAMLGLSGYRTVIHPAPLDSRTIRTIKSRYDSLTVAPCYADLVIDDLVYSREYARGRKLKALMRFRDFGSTATALRGFVTMVEAKLSTFSLDPPVTTAEATVDLIDAFKADLQTFSMLVAKQPQPETQTIKGSKS